MLQLIITLHVLLCLGLIALVLIQHGKGADMGASFGSGASQTVFGSQGSASFLMKLTGLLAALFFATSLTLTYMVGQISKPQDLNAGPTQQVPASLSNEIPQPKEDKQP